MEHICVKCSTQMKKAKLVGHGDIFIKTEGKKLFDSMSSKINTYVCPSCGYIEYFVESPGLFQ